MKTFFIFTSDNLVRKVVIMSVARSLSYVKQLEESMDWESQAWKMQGRDVDLLLIYVIEKVMWFALSNKTIKRIKV